MKIEVNGEVLFEFANDHLDENNESTVYPSDWKVPFENISDFVHDLESLLKKYSVREFKQ